jgi:hypothetical protein
MLANVKARKVERRCIAELRAGLTCPLDARRLCGTGRDTAAPPPGQRRRAFGQALARVTAAAAAEA